MGEVMVRRLSSALGAEIRSVAIAGGLDDAVIADKIARGQPPELTSSEQGHSS